jgi:NADPH:quinone reductase-like Zn-dependent oxidoreductase
LYGECLSLTLCLSFRVRPSALLSLRPEMGKLDGKVIIVTGASSGIGEAVAKNLAAEGANVAVLARRYLQDARRVHIGASMRLDGP